MQSCETTKEHDTTKVSAEKLIGPKEIISALDVTGRTVRRWAKSYKWKEYRLSHKVIRYIREEVEDTLGVLFIRKEED